MPGLFHLTVAISTVLIFASPLHAQAPRNSSIGPATDSSVTTGIGTGSSIKAAPPLAGQPPRSSRPVFLDSPEERMNPTEKEGAQGVDKDAGKPAAAAAPAAVVVEDPRTMISRDRIESPQH